MSNATDNATDTADAPKYDSDNPETWRDVDTPTAKREAAAVDLDLLGELTPSQIRAVKEIRAAALDKIHHESARVAMLKVCSIGGRRISVVVKVVRTDCDEYSPRAIYTNVRGHFFVGPRGGIEVKSDVDATAEDLQRHPLIYGFERGI